MSLSRRSLIQGAGIAAVSLALPPIVATPALAATDPSPAPAGWDFHGQSPSAQSVTPRFSGRIRTMQPYEGKLYLGYGDYGGNSGSQTGLGTDVSYFDPATGAFGIALAAYNTEEINTYRELNGKLYAPGIDPFAGSASCASNHFGEWARAKGIGNAEHVYDMATDPDGALYLSGASGGGIWNIATIWKSTDGGQSWEVWFEEAPEADQYRDGFERIYWLATIGDKLYFRANNGSKTAKPAPMRCYDFKRQRWSTVGDTQRGKGKGKQKAIPVMIGVVHNGSDALSANGLVYFSQLGGLYVFDGKKGSQLARSQVAGMGDDGKVYILNGTGVHRVDGRTVTPVIEQAGLSAGSIAVSGGRVYLGGYNSEVWSRAL